MEYILTLLKHDGDGLPGVILSAGDKDRQIALSQNPTWKIIHSNRFVTQTVYPKAICNVVLMTEETAERQFKDVLDTWLGPTQDDPLNNYDRYASQEDSKTVLDKDYLDRLEGDESRK